MKKYLKSGFNTTQNIKLEAGTYSLVAYVKSLYGNTYTFALGYDGAQGVEWTEYDVDVVKNQLCKVWFTFTIREKITKLKPISSSFSASLPVYVADLQLTRGNVPVESGASPFDFDEIINDVQADANTFLAKTKFMTEIDGGLIYSAMMKLYDAGGAGDEMAGISGIAGDDKSDPVFWAGGTYDQAIGGTAKAIIRHDGSSKFTDAEIEGDVSASSGSIGGWSIENMGLLSDNKLFYIDALNGAIYLLDENGDVKTSIIPNDLPSTPEAFFDGSGGGSLSLVALQGSYNNGQVKTTGSFTVDVSGGKQFSLLIPQIKGSVHTDYTALAGETSGSSNTTIYFELIRNSKVHLTLAQPLVFSTGGLTSENFTIQQRTIQISSLGIYSLRARVVTNVTPSNHSATGGASVSTISSPAEFIAVVNRSQIGNNGMIIASSTTRYDYMVGDKHVIRRGKYGFRVTEDGLQKSSNMNELVPTWEKI